MEHAIYNAGDNSILALIYVNVGIAVNTKKEIELINWF